MNEKYWGYHLTLDCHNCDRLSIKNEQRIRDFMRSLLDRIQMKPIGDTHIEYTASDHSDKAGFTAVQIIVTSTIVAHFVDSTGDLYLDVFSCKKYDIDKVKCTVNEFFNPTKTRTNFLTRQAG